jgi:hypothetical protein
MVHPCSRRDADEIPIVGVAKRDSAPAAAYCRDALLPRRPERLRLADHREQFGAVHPQHRIQVAGQPLELPLDLQERVHRLAGQRVRRDPEAKVLILPVDRREWVTHRWPRISSPVLVRFMRRHLRSSAHVCVRIVHQPMMKISLCRSASDGRL